VGVPLGIDSLDALDFLSGLEYIFLVLRIFFKGVKML
jgi:hypothetical protein